MVKNKKSDTLDRFYTQDIVSMDVTTAGKVVQTYLFGIPSGFAGVTGVVGDKSRPRYKSYKVFFNFNGDTKAMISFFSLRLAHGGTWTPAESDKHLLLDILDEQTDKPFELDKWRQNFITAPSFGANQLVLETVTGKVSIPSEILSRINQEIINEDRNDTSPLTIIGVAMWSAANGFDNTLTAYTEIEFDTVHTKL